MNELKEGHIERIDSDVREIMKKYGVSIDVAINYLKIAALEGIDCEVSNLYS